MESKTTHFDNLSKENTDEVMKIVQTRAKELQIKTVVVASYHGRFIAEKTVKTLAGRKS
jgi:hypothetical protein